MIQHNKDWILSLQGFVGQILYHFPRHPLMEFAKHMEFIFPIRVSSEPLDGTLYIFTDSSSSGRAIVFTYEDVMHIKTKIKSSAQQTEIRAIILTFKKFPQTFNLYSDSKYIITLFPAMKTTLLSGRSPIFPLL